MSELTAPFDKLPLTVGEVITFTKTNGTFHRSFDEAFAASSSALYHYQKPLFRKARWVRLAYTEIKSAELDELKPPVLLLLGLMAFSLVVIGAAIARNPANPLAWLVGALSLYFPYLAYKSARNRLGLTIRLSRGCYRISTPLDGYKDETLADNSILRRIYALMPNVDRQRPQ